MPNYLVESYPADTPSGVEEARERARSLGDDDDGVRFVRTTFLPGDETILHVVEAPSLAALRRAVAGFAVLNGTVTDGSFEGAQVHQRSDFAGIDGDKTVWTGELQLMPASA